MGRMITKRAAAELLGYSSTRSVDLLVKANRIGAYRYSPKAQPKFDAEELESFKESSRFGAPADKEQKHGRRVEVIRYSRFFRDRMNKTS